MMNTIEYHNSLLYMIFIANYYIYYQITNPGVGRWDKAYHLGYGVGC